MSGEQKVPEWCASNMLGSTPRVRGTGHGAIDVHPVERNNPACAGKGDFSERTPTLFEDQPRECGEKDFTTSRFSSQLSSFISTVVSILTPEYHRSNF